MQPVGIVYRKIVVCIAKNIRIGCVKQRLIRLTWRNEILSVVEPSEVDISDPVSD